MSPRQSLPLAWHIPDCYSAIRVAGLLSLALDPADPVRRSIFQQLGERSKAVSDRAMELSVRDDCDTPAACRYERPSKDIEGRKNSRTSVCKTRRIL